MLEEPSRQTVARSRVSRRPSPRTQPSPRQTTQPSTAPEVGSKERIGRATDLWGVGLILRELLGGHFPYEAYPRKASFKG